jgi:hypothetical protein
MVVDGQVDTGVLAVLLRIAVGETSSSFAGHTSPGMRLLRWVWRHLRGRASGVA